MSQSVLVVMAAGMSRRFGELKQLTPVDGCGRCLPEYACIDGALAGFESVVFVLREEIRARFHQSVGRRVARLMDVRYAIQGPEGLPAAILAQGRTKPPGTAHALLCAQEAVGDRPFAAVNADDFYGRPAYAAAARFLEREGGPGLHALVGYRLADTLSGEGGVSRGLCTADENGYLLSIRELRDARRAPDGGLVATDAGGGRVFLPEDAVASMNLWAFSPGFFPALQEGFARFVREDLPADPKGAEFALPDAVGAAMRQGLARVRVLPSGSKWMGITHPGDLPRLRAAMEALQADYPFQG